MSIPEGSKSKVSLTVSYNAPTPVDPPQEKYSFLRRYFELQHEGLRKETLPCSVYCQGAEDVNECLQDCLAFKQLCEWHRKN